MKRYWLSFAAKGEFRGACIVRAPDFLSAVKETWNQGINPGGSVMGGDLPEWAVVDEANIGVRFNEDRASAMIDDFKHQEAIRSA